MSAAARYERACGVADHRSQLHRAAGGLELRDVVLERRREIVARHLVVKREKCGQHDGGIRNLVRRQQRGKLSIPLELPNAVSVDKEHVVDSHCLFPSFAQRFGCDRSVPRPRPRRRCWPSWSNSGS